MAVRTCRKSMAIVCVGERDGVKDDYRRRAGQRDVRMQRRPCGCSGSSQNAGQTYDPVEPIPSPITCAQRSVIRLRASSSRDLAVAIRELLCAAGGSSANKLT